MPALSSLWATHVVLPARHCGPHALCRLLTNVTAIQVKGMHAAPLPLRDQQALQALVHHPLADDLQLHDAPFWSPQQAQMLKEKIRCDDDWAIVVDQLSESLHEDAVRRQTGR